MGYAEYNAAGFYASAGYSATGLNDGLTWGVDAFDAIQKAVDAAAAALRGLQGRCRRAATAWAWIRAPTPSG